MVTTPVDNESVLVQRYEPLVVSIVDKLRAHLPSHVDRDDLIAAGRIGLLDAIRRFDPSRGFNFSTFAVPRIRGGVKDELRKCDHLSRLERRRVREGLREDVLHVAMDKPTEDGGTLADVLSHDGEELTRAQRELLHDVSRNLHLLSSQERIVIEAKMRDEDQVSICKTLKVSESRVSQLMTSARRKLRRHMGVKMKARTCSRCRQTGHRRDHCPTLHDSTVVAQTDASVASVRHLPMGVRGVDLPTTIPPIPLNVELRIKVIVSVEVQK